MLADSFTMAERRSDAEVQGPNMIVELSVEVDPMTDEATERSFTFTKPAVAQNVADLTAEVDFEIGPDVTSKLAADLCVLCHIKLVSAVISSRCVGLTAAMTCLCMCATLFQPVDHVSAGFAAVSSHCHVSRASLVLFQPVQHPRC